MNLFGFVAARDGEFSEESSEDMLQTHRFPTRLISHHLTPVHTHNSMLQLSGHKPSYEPQFPLRDCAVAPNHRSMAYLTASLTVATRQYYDRNRPRGRESYNAYNDNAARRLGAHKFAMDQS